MITFPQPLFDRETLRQDLDRLLSWGPRSLNDTTALSKTIAFIDKELSDSGYEVQFHRFDQGAGDCNIIAERQGSAPQSPVFEIGAHFDTVPGSPGADDNGSGVVGLLAIARFLATRSVTRSIRFCFFGREETGLQGSRAHQAWLDHDGRQTTGTIVFEMIGCRNTCSDSQKSPIRIPLLFSPPRTGDFIAVVSNWRSRSLAKAFVQALEDDRPPIPAFQITRIGGLLKDAGRSDHASYWDAGRPAIMLTDTANFRNPHYHRDSDLITTIDFDFLAANAQATARVAMNWASQP